MPPSLPRRSVETQYPHPLFIFVFESQTNGGSGKKNGWGRSHLCQVVSVCYSHLVCSTHLVDKRGSLEQERSSLYHLGSVKVLCVFFKRGNLYHLGLVKVLCVCFFKPRATRSHLCHVSSACSSILFAPRISRTNVDPSSKHEPVFTMLGSVKVLCLFFLTPEQARSHLCHVRPV